MFAQRADLGEKVTSDRLNTCSCGLLCKRGHRALAPQRSSRLLICALQAWSPIPSHSSRSHQNNAARKGKIVEYYGSEIIKLIYMSRVKAGRQ